MYQEKRRFARSKKPFNIQYLAGTEGGKENWVTVFLRDISENGMSFSADKNFSPGEIINARIKIPFNPFQWIELKGRCVDSKLLSIGICITHLEFIDLHEEQRKAIREYITWILEKQG